MIHIQDLIKISDHEWEIPRSFRDDMRVPVRIFATAELIKHIAEDRSFEQAVNTATLPGLIGQVVVMPDMHQGYGFPIGAVAATIFPEGIISPGGIGYDINCGVRLLASKIQAEAVAADLEILASVMNEFCPSGVGRAGALKLDMEELDCVMRHGSKWAFSKGYATRLDLQHTEDGGCLTGAQPEKVSQRARERGGLQIGSLGSGNHFIEVDQVSSIFDPATAAIFGLKEGCLVVQIHCGSRGLGHQVCTDYVQEFQSVVHKYAIDLPDRELVCAPINSPEGLAYLGAMRAAANFAFVNRQILAHSVRRAFEKTFSSKLQDWQLVPVYDLCHIIAKIETHLVNGIPTKVCIHRKGATRAFGPGVTGLPAEFIQTGQPVLVPGSMGTASWVLAGTETSMRSSFGSSCHGAGRMISRARAKQENRGTDLLHTLERRGIHVRAGSLDGLAEEAPSAYKDVDAVVETVVASGIAHKVARLTPLVVVKG
jgi:tRNA-splicing ligase RtcB (3'-phosphate/5'-hydroxy nucleic acid ligase)